MLHRTAASTPACRSSASRPPRQYQSQNPPQLHRIRCRALASDAPMHAPQLQQATGPKPTNGTAAAERQSLPPLASASALAAALAAAAVPPPLPRLSTSSSEVS